MRKLFLLIFTFSTLTSFSQAEWEVFQSFDGKFKILTPGEMEKRENSIKTEIGELNYITFLHQTQENNSENLIYIVSYCDYPKYSVHSDSTILLKEFFQTTVETAVTSVKGSLQYSSDITLDDFPGMLWRVDYNDDQATIKTKAFVAENRYYSIQVISLKDKRSNLQIDKFLDSFTLIGYPEKQSP